LIPAAYIMGLADVDSQYALYYYYSYPFLPFLFLGAALGLARLIRLSRKKNLFFQGFHAKRPLAALALAVIVAAACYSAIQPTRTDHFRRMPLKSTERHAWIRGILRERIPCGASVAAQFDLLAQLPYREAIYPLSEKNLGRAEYWVMDLQGFRGDVKADEMRRILERVDTLVREGKGEVMVDGQGLLIVRQKSED